MKVESEPEPASRPYHKKARAEAERATGEAILDAAFAAFGHETFDRVTLQQIAEDAGVTVQTVIRRFGSKEELFQALAARERPRILASRGLADGEGIEAALRALIKHYEDDGDTVLNFIAQESRVPLVSELVQEGREAHRAWVKRHCAPLFSGVDAADREELLYAAISATDVYTWKLLRRDRGLEAPRVHAVMMRILNGLKRRD
ncbi:MAG: TetR/AcrR family transcriptional regulator [Spirochaetaceae bacterium]